MEQNQTFSNQVEDFYHQLNLISDKYNLQTLTLQDKESLMILNYNLIVTDGLHVIFDEQRMMPIKNLFQLIGHLNPNFLEEVVKVLQDWIDRLDPSIEDMKREIILYYMISYWPNLILQLRSIQRPLSVLIHLENLSIARQVEQFLTKSDFFHIISQIIMIPHQYSEFTNQHWDIVISDQQLPNIQFTHFVRIEGTPTIENIARIYQLLGSIASENKDHTPLSD